MRVSLFVVIVAATLPASPALAEDPRAAAIVVYPSDFASPDGETRLNRRILTAVEAVCRAKPGEDVRRSDVVACRKKARSEIDAQISVVRQRNGVSLSAQ